MPDGVQYWYGGCYYYYSYYYGYNADLSFYYDLVVTCFGHHKWNPGEIVILRLEASLSVLSRYKLDFSKIN